MSGSTPDPTIPDTGQPQRPEPVSPQGVGREWSPLVEKIQAGDQSAMAVLYQTFSRGVRFYLCRHLGPQELDDKVHDTFLIVVQAIRNGDLREPERLMGFVRTIVRRQVAGHIEEAVQARKELADIEMGSHVADQRGTPEERAIRRQKAEIMKSALREISERDREILTRFYIREQPQEEICREMDLSETQFRLLKSRAKARFGEMGRRKLAATAVPQKILRKAAGSGH
jgi:RNA polymerase sigma-70 factor (ECF subfamily)